MEYKIIKEVSLVSKQATGKTKHYSGSEQLLPAFKLQIVQYDGGEGFYLFYLGKNDEVMTDTYHITIEGAMEQAEWEYNTKPEEWLNVSD